MSYTYAQRRNTGEAARAARPAEGPQIGELAAGAQPTQEQMGSRVDLPGEIREKMEGSFGADFSGVKLYESQTVADAGAEAVTQGNTIAFAPGKLDLASTAGQALLGHELSHVVSQARGESAGQGFLNDARLEAQADRQGEMAARGESVFQGPVSPIGASAAAGAAGPMQAKKRRNMSAAERLEDDFNHVKMGRTEESQKAGRKKQLEMLIQAYAYADMGGTDLAQSDEGHQIKNKADDLLEKVTGSGQILKYTRDIAEMRSGLAKNAMEKRGDIQSADDRYSLFSSADASEIAAHNMMITNFGVMTPMEQDMDYIQALKDGDVGGHYIRYQSLTDRNGHDAEEIGSARAQELLASGMAEKNERAEAWYERLMGRKRKR